MKRIFQASAAAFALALVAGTAVGQTNASPPATNAPAASTAPDAPAVTGDSAARQGKDLGEIKQTPAEKKAAHDKKASAKSGTKRATKHESAVAPQAGKHLEKKPGVGAGAEPATKL